MDIQQIQKYLEGNATHDEREEMGKWIDADEKNKEQFLLLRGIYDATLWNMVPEENSRTEKKDKKRLVREFLKIAAVFIIAFGCFSLLSLLWNTTSQPLSMRSVYVPGGQRAELDLSDGSNVWLNAQSRLFFPDAFSGDKRVVQLIGEGYFIVAPDESLDFIVEADGYQVRVLGTEFGVKSYPERNYFEASLIKGSVEVTSERTNEQVILRPHTKVFSSDGKLTVTELTNLHDFLWRDGIIAFDDELVEDIFDKLRLYYDIEIEVRKKELLTHHYTGKFRTKDGIEHVLKVLRLAHEFKYTRDNENNKIIIY